MRSAFVARLRLIAALLCCLTVVASNVPTAAADPYPPVLNTAHFAPVAWPANGSWRPYTSQSDSINDPRTQDPSNGGTSPQNYANVSSSCTDTTAPSVFWQYDPAGQTVFFRWRVEQVANTYATGPSAGSFGSGDPWVSALWTVLIDTNGDGYRDFAAHLDGSSGSPSAAVDRLVGIYGTSKSQSIDYVNDPQIHQLAHNPTAFVDTATSRILNFHNTLTPNTSWPNGSAETVWDYGTTRATNLSPSSSCTEYLIDYQIPLGLLDASAVGGPTVTATTPLSFMFATSNSLNNPMQKDAVLNGDYIADPTRPAPFGDTITFAGGSQDQPSVTAVTVAGCGPATLTAQVSDAIKFVGGAPQTTVAAVDFYSYTDTNSNGQPDDGSSWTFAASGSTTNRPLGQWRGTWNSSSLPRGQFLIGVKATDAQGNVTWSYRTQADIGPTPQNYANPTPTPGLVFATFVNSCGTPPPSMRKSASPATVTAGQTTQFTITVDNTSSAPLTVAGIDDALPPGFSYVSTDGGTLGAPSSAPTAAATGTISWSFSPAVTVPAGASRTLIFTAQASSVVGTYSNVATGSTSVGALTTPPAQVAVGAPRLTIGKTASVASANPGDTITYTITYANDSPVSVTGATITDVLPNGLAFGTATNGGTYNLGTRTVSWPIGALASGDGPFTVSFTAIVANPYPTAAAVPLINTATISSNESAPASASASSYINAPRPVITIQKDATTTQVAAGANATFTISFTNSGNAPATNLVVSDTLPAGFTFVSATNSGTHSAGVVTWNVASLAAGATTSVQVVAQAAASFTAPNPATNTASVVSDQTTVVSDTYQIGVTQTGSICSTYYFRAATAAVGFDGTRRIATTTSPTGSTAASISGAVTSATEIARFYADPATLATVNFAGTLSTSIYITKSGGPQIDFIATVYDYNPTTGASTSLGTASKTYNGNTANEVFTFSISTSGTLAKGHRLLWVIVAASSNVNNTSSFNLLFDGTASPSGANFCVTPPANLVVDKAVNTLSVAPGGTLAYTLRFANTGQTNATGAQLVDTLPAGTTFTSATLNGSAITPAISGQQLTFTLRSSDTATAGQVTGGQGGVLVVNVAVATPLSSAIRTLSNTATLQSNETSPISDTRTTAVVLPDVTITKAADKTLLVPGDTVTYTLTALNGGVGTASPVTISDVLPATGYFTYVAGSAKLNGVAIAPEPVSGGNLTVNAGALASGATTTVTYQMTVAMSGVPDGVTSATNTAMVADAQTVGSRSSAPVVVAISTNPNLRLVKTAAPLTARPGDLVTYSLVLSNVGSSAALDVSVQDPIPASMHFAPGTLLVDAAAQTDAADADSAAFDAANNRVSFAISSLAAGASRTLRFGARVDLPLGNGATTIPNTATVTAANAAGKSSAAAITANAAPNLTLVKAAPLSVAYPLSTLDGAASGTVIDVADAANFAVGDVIVVGGTAARITSIAGTQLTLDTAVAGASGAPVLPTFEYVLSYGNTGDADASAVVITDALPGGLTFVAADAGGTFAAGTVTWNLGTVAAGASGAVRVRVAPSAAGVFDNTAAIDSAETAPAPSNTTRTSAGGIEVFKLTETPTVTNTLVGAQATYVILLRNQLAAPATGVAVTDLLPSGFTYNSTLDIGGNATRDGVTNPTPGDAVPSWGTWTIPGNDVLYIRFVADIAASVGPATYQNGVTAVSSNTMVLPFDELNTTDEDVTVSVPTEPILAATKTAALQIDADSNTAFDAGDTIRYTVVVSQIGGPAANSVVFTDTPDANTALVGGSVQTSVGTVVTGGQVGDTAVEVDLGTLAPGASATITFDVTINKPLPGGTVTIINQGAVAASGIASVMTDDPTTAPLADPTITQLATSPDLGVTVTPDKSTLVPGETLAYTLAYSNTGNVAALGSVLTVTVPAGTTFLPASSEIGWVCAPDNAAGSSCTFDLGSVKTGSGGSVIFAVAVNSTVAAGQGSVDLAATIADDGTNGADRNLGNNTASASTPLVAAPDLVVTKTDGVTAAAPGASLTYMLTITNSGTQGATGVVVTDALPANVTFSVASDSGSYSAGPRTVTWPAVALAAGAIIQRTVTVTVASTVPAGTETLLNTASAVTDGNDGPDPTPGDNTGSDTDALTAAPDLRVTDDDGGATAALSGDVTYTIGYSNVGSQAATGVVLTATVPANTVYKAAGSSAWSCADGAVAGTVCTLTVGPLAPAAGADAFFVVTVSAAVPGGTTDITHAVTIADDGANGADPTPADNSASDVTPFSPTAITLLRLSAVRKPHSVDVLWATSAELNVAGFRIYRGTDRTLATATLLTPVLIDGQGRTDGFAYTYTDTTVADGVQYYYWLEEVATEGGGTMHGPATAATSTRIWVPLVHR